MRWMKFNAVGAAGIAVQLAALAFLTRVLGFHTLVATGIAVEIAVLHNFAWHIRWTWADRQNGKPGDWVAMLLRFHLTNGIASIAGNLLFVQILTGVARLGPFSANLLSIAFCSLVNYSFANRFVFLSRSITPGDTERSHGRERERDQNGEPARKAIVLT